VSDRPVERKLAAIFAADIAGYSRLMGADEAGTVTRLKASRAIIDRLIAANRGRIFNTAGDSVVADFASAVDAVQCAVAVQEALAEESAPQGSAEKMQFRIGVHVGDVVVDGANLLGDGVNIAARLEGIAEPGAICLSGAARDQIGNKLPVSFDDLGEQQVKNIAQPIRVYRVGPLPSRPHAGETPAIQPVAALPLPDKPSIAVLPFQNISGDPEQEYFADGMVEEIITALSRLRWFFVIARNSTFTYKGRAVDVKEVGRELGVRYVLEGSVRKSANRIRVTAQLVEAATGNHVWAERVVAAIEPELYAAEHIRSQSKPPDSLDAWECVIRALSLIGQGTRDENTEAEALCRRAIAIAPGYARAHSLLAWALLRRTTWSGDFRVIA
jgi:adenylate cyclase